MKKKGLQHSRHERAALVLQGGGALGAYQAGVYQALTELGYPPDWVAGVSIGAINAALIAGNPPDRRIERLREFWERVSSGLGEIPAPPNGLHRAYNATSALRSALFGVPGLFTPRLSPFFGAEHIPSVYDTSPLRATLEELVDFDRINAREMRLSVGAVNVATGNSVYFDNARDAIRPEHVLASAALPPGFPAIEVDGEFYWDGGIVSNTPLQHVIDDKPRVDTLVFQVDVFSAHGAVPSNVLEVMKRHKEILYSSRTRYNTDSLVVEQRLRQQMERLIAKLPPDLQDDEDVRELRKSCSAASLDIVHLIYHGGQEELESTDYEFSRASINERWERGYTDVMRINEHREWLIASTPELGVRVYDVHEPEKRTRDPAASSRKVAAV